MNPTVKVPEFDPIEREAREARDAALRESRRAHTERRERPARRERQHEPEGSWGDWNAWCDARIQAAIERERAAIVKNVEQAVGECIATVAHNIQRDLRKEFEEIERKLQELEALWKKSLSEYAVEVAQLQDELARVKASHNSICVDLARPTLRMQ
jgi:hypothetical protein